MSYKYKYVLGDMSFELASSLLEVINDAEGEGFGGEITRLFGSEIRRFFFPSRPPYWWEPKEVKT